LKLRRIVIATLSVLLLFSWFPPYLHEVGHLIHYIGFSFFFSPIGKATALALHILIPLSLGIFTQQIYRLNKALGFGVLLGIYLFAGYAGMRAWRSNFPRDWWMYVMMFDSRYDNIRVQLLVGAVWMFLVIAGFTAYAVYNMWIDRRRAVL